MAIGSFKILSKLSPTCLHDIAAFKDCIILDIQIL